MKSLINKNSSILKLLLVLVIIVSSCNQLDLTPISSKSVENFYQNNDQLDQAIMGCYSGLQDAFVNSKYSYMLTASRSDNTFQTTAAYNDYDISRFITTPNLSVLFVAWSDLYNKIYSCNKILEALNKLGVNNDPVREQIEGEAKFLRALYYFDLVRFFGGVPIVKKPLSVEEARTLSRSSIKEVYNLIVDDLSDAITLLPESYDDENLGRATKWAAKGFLAKVYIFMSGYPLKLNYWAKADKQLIDVINSGRFQFFSNYTDIFDYQYERGKQSVFSIYFKAGVGGEGNFFPTRNAPNAIKKGDDYIYGGSPYQLFVSEDLRNSFEPGDLRKNASIRFSWVMNTGDTITSQPFCQKYANGPVAGRNDWDINFILLRYTDILMMHAECLNELGYVANGKAFDIMNKVRTRAGLSSLTSADVPNQQSFRDWVGEERRHEFCFENRRWFYLVRTDRASTIMKKFLNQYGLGTNVKGKWQYLFPVPQRVINVNSNIKQNPNY